MMGKTKKLNDRPELKETIVLILLAFATGVPRFSSLGYSNFYGDETKTFYWDKTVPAKEFLLNQRKGPIQFVVVWTMEKLTSFLGLISTETFQPSRTFSEFWIRLPFAVAGFLSVFALYFFIRKVYNWKVAAITAFLYSITGFYVAFSRTIQYQSFLLLFGFLANLFFLWALDPPKKHESSLFYLLSGVFMSLAFLSHWDAIFFSIPLAYFWVTLHEKTNFKKLLWFLLPFFVLTGLFYIPYFTQGLFTKHTIGYIGRRVVDGEYVSNYSPYTFFVYTPFYWFFLPLVFAFAAFLPSKDSAKNNAFAIWFIAALITFQLIFSNPGTHIHLYLIPALILSGSGFMYVYNLFSSEGAKRFLSYPLIAFFLAGFIYNLFVYVPQLHLGYPWRGFNSRILRLPEINKDRHLFLYGFPYNRKWNDVQDYLYSKQGVRNIYTNDNATVAEHYLRRYDVIAPGSNFLPQYFVLVRDSHEFWTPNAEFLNYYSMDKIFYDFGGIPITAVLRLKQP